MAAEDEFGDGLPALSIAPLYDQITDLAVVYVGEPDMGELGRPTELARRARRAAANIVHTSRWDASLERQLQAGVRVNAYPKPRPKVPALLALSNAELMKRAREATAYRHPTWVSLPRGEQHLRERQASPCFTPAPSHRVGNHAPLSEEGPEEAVRCISFSPPPSRHRASSPPRPPAAAALSNPAFALTPMRVHGQRPPSPPSQRCATNVFMYAWTYSGSSGVTRIKSH